MMQIPNRLKVIGDFIHDGAHIVDIGADHGLLEQYIALHLENYSILAVENKRGPLEALREATKDIKNVTTSLSDGMDKVTSEYDTVVLAGMGGDNIINILSKHPEKLNSINQIIVDAHSFIPKVRKTIIDFGFDIEKEKLVYESGVYYVIISFKRNSKPRKYTKDQIDFGYKLSEDKLYKDYKNHILQKYQNVINDMEKSGCKNQKYNEIKDEMRRFESYEQN